MRNAQNLTRIVVFVNYLVDQMREGGDAWGMWHMWWSREMYTEELWGKPEGNGLYQGLLLRPK